MKSTPRFGPSFFTAHPNSPRAARICAIGNEPMEKARSLLSPCCVEVTPNETWKIYSHDRGHPFVDHFPFRARHRFQGGTGENKVQQKISEISRGPFVRCYFTRIHAGTVGQTCAREGPAVPVEKSDRNDCLLGRRETGR